MSESGFAHRACRRCHSRKIKCDRQLPSCRECSENERVCSYEPPSRPSAARRHRREPRLTSFLPLPQATDGETSATGSDGRGTTTSTDTAIAFLDEDVFRRSLSSTLAPALESSISDHVRDLVEGPATMRAVVKRFFDSSATWIPILSRARFLDTALTPLRPPSASTYFLCLCMSLHTEPLDSDSNARDAPRYRAARMFFEHLQSTSMYNSLSILQGRVLVLAYEIGHALYPEAFMGIAVCVQLAAVMGLEFEHSGSGKHSHQPLASDLDLEAGNRTWWAIYLLERIANLGRLQPRMLTPEPSLSTVLPINDKDWHDGRLSQTRYTLGKPSSDVGGFAGNARAAYLLSCAYVFDIEQGKKSTGEDDGETRGQLSRTIWAQLEVIKTLSEARTPIECTSSAICLSALTVLSRSVDITGNSLEPHERGFAPLEVAARTALWVATCFLRESHHIEFGSVSPYTLPWLYASARFILVQGSKADFEIVKMAVKRLRLSWRAADVYLRLLEAYEVTALPEV